MAAAYKGGKVAESGESWSLEKLPEDIIANFAAAACELADEERGAGFPGVSVAMVQSVNERCCAHFDTEAPPVVLFTGEFPGDFMRRCNSVFLSVDGNKLRMDAPSITASAWGGMLTTRRSRVGRISPFPGEGRGRKVTPSTHLFATSQVAIRMQRYPNVVLHSVWYLCE
jgi:hypothetical protein